VCPRRVDTWVTYASGRISTPSLKQRNCGGATLRRMMVSNNACGVSSRVHTSRWAMLPWANATPSPSDPFHPNALSMDSTRRCSTRGSVSGRLGDVQAVTALIAVPVASGVLGAVRVHGVHPSPDGRQPLHGDHQRIISSTHEVPP